MVELEELEVVEEITICGLQPERDRLRAEACTEIMVNSEPWITLRRDRPTAMSWFTSTKRETHVAMCRDTVAGFIVLCHEGPFVGYVQSLGVAAEFRGHGIGSRLLRHAEHRFLQDYPNVFICVSSFNPRARGFYRRHGYHEVGELMNFIVPDHSEILLRKSIAPLTEFKR